MTMLITLFILAAVVACLFTLLIFRIAARSHIVDVPADAIARKIHDRPVPLLGGVAIFLTVSIVAFLTLLLGLDARFQVIPFKYFVGIFFGGLALMIGGYCDDRWHWAPGKQIIFPIIAACMVIASGIGITYVTNPFGGQIHFDLWSLTLFSLQDIPYKLTLPADILTFLWLMGMMYTTKLLDGLDGLVSGVTVIGALTIAALALDPIIAQYGTALLAIVLAGSFSGFIPWNWHPARIFLGEGGSLFAGFMLGVLAIISGSKVATTVLVVGIPILDAAWVILRRTIWERHSPFVSDRRHLHHRLLDLGFSHRSVVGMYYFFAVYFGIAALFMQSKGKLIALIILSVIMIVLGGGLVYSYSKRKHLL